MRNFILIVILMIFITSTNCIVSSSTGDSLPHLSGDVRYKLRKCEVYASCSQCSFTQLKQVHECMINGNIQVNQCTRVNKEDETDILIHYAYEPCQLQGFKNYLKYIFILFLFGSFSISVYLLRRHREYLENKMYSKLSINRLAFNS